MKTDTFDIHHDADGCETLAAVIEELEIDVGWFGRLPSDGWELSCPLLRGAGWIMREDPEEVLDHGPQCHAAPAPVLAPDGPWVVSDFIDGAATLDEARARLAAALDHLRALGDRPLARRVDDGLIVLAA